jgi:Protein of unknown function (DUF4242)
MPKYLIERNMPNVGSLSREDLAALADRSCQALYEVGPDIQWVESFVTADKIYSVYIARDQKPIREHACLSGIPADSICEVMAVIDPSTAREARRAQQRDTAKEAGIW